MKRKTINKQSIRGRYHESITENLFVRIAGDLVAQGIRVIALAHDPRPSSQPLCRAFVQGFTRSGGDVLLLGTMPTPMLHHYAVTQSIDCSVMITASHNPVSDNGLKIFSTSGFKQINIERLQSIISPHIGTVRNVGSIAKSSYIKALKSRFKISRRKCLVDTARGVWDDHLDILEALDIDVVHQKDASRINQYSGCLEPSIRLNSGYDLVVMVDGDGDRLSLISQNKILDGDDIMHILFNQQPQSMVGSVLTNTALEESITAKGYQLKRTLVGCHHISGLLKDTSYRIGGEPCGHIIDMDWLSSSDPMYLLYLLLEADDLTPLDNKYPQLNWNISSQADIATIENICRQFSLRYIVRHSGTEKCIRVMLEGCQKQIEACSEAINLQTLAAFDS